LEIIGSLLQYLGSLIRERFGNIRASWIRYSVGSVLGVAIFSTGLFDAYDYFERFGKLIKGREARGGREVLMSKAASRYMETHQVWIDTQFVRSSLTLDVLLWRPTKESHGEVIGGLNDPWYQMVRFTDWESFPDPKGEKPIAFLSNKRNTLELASVFESFESREFPNWYETAPLFSVSFIDPGELKKKLAEVRKNPEEDSEALWAQRGHGLLGTYYDGIVWSVATERLVPTAVEEGRVSKTQIDTSIDFFWSHSEKPAPSFSVEWKGFLQIDRSGDYVFATKSDGRSAVYIDGRRVVNNWLRRPREGKLALERGLHALTIRYDDHSSVASVQFLWKTKNEPLSLVPAKNLRVAR